MKMRCEKARKFVSLALDGRIDTAARLMLQAHLLSCPGCREWQREQAGLRDLLKVPQELQPSPGFHAGLRRRIGTVPTRSASFSPFFSRPLLLRAAIFLLFAFSALLGLFLGGRLDPAAPGAGATAFSQALNLDAFADLPGDSFGAVYERLLQGEPQ